MTRSDRSKPLASLRHAGRTPQQTEGVMDPSTYHRTLRRLKGAA